MHTGLYYTTNVFNVTITGGSKLYQLQILFVSLVSCQVVKNNCYKNKKKKEGVEIFFMQNS